MIIKFKCGCTAETYLHNGYLGAGEGLGLWHCEKHGYGQPGKNNHTVNKPGNLIDLEIEHVELQSVKELKENYL